MCAAFICAVSCIVVILLLVVVVVLLVVAVVVVEKVLVSIVVAACFEVVFTFYALTRLEINANSIYSKTLSSDANLSHNISQEFPPQQSGNVVQWH